jgi:hypothetical protein
MYVYKIDIKSTQNDTLLIVNLFISLRYSLMHLSPLKKERHVYYFLIQKSLT